LPDKLLACPNCLLNWTDSQLTKDMIAVCKDELITAALRFHSPGRCVSFCIFTARKLFVFIIDYRHWELWDTVPLLFARKYVRES